MAEYFPPEWEKTALSVLEEYEKRKPEALGELMQEALMMFASPAGAAVQKVLKPYAIGKMIPGAIQELGTEKKLLKRLLKEYSGSTQKYLDTEIRTPGILTALLQVPQKEYRRIKSFDWAPPRGGTLGEFIHSPPGIELNPKMAKGSTVWHEFTHARQHNPLDEELLAAWMYQKEMAREVGISALDFYKHYSPTEAHARRAARVVGRYPLRVRGKQFEEAYLDSLVEIMGRSRMAQKDRELARWSF